MKRGLTHFEEFDYVRGWRYCLFGNKYRREKMKRISVFCVLIAILLCVNITHGQSTRSVWSGCYQIVFVPDSKTGIIRKLVRREGPHGVRPGTGQWGEWQEHWCQVPGVDSYGSQKGWPLQLTQLQVKELLGPLADRLNKERKVLESETVNLTGYKFHILGGDLFVTKKEWNSLPAVKTQVPQRLHHYTEDTGQLIPGEVYPPPGDPRLRIGSGWKPKTLMYRHKGGDPGPLQRK
jgi:hypothetical protein